MLTKPELIDRLLARTRAPTLAAHPIPLPPHEGRPRRERSPRNTSPCSRACIPHPSPDMFWRLRRALRRRARRMTVQQPELLRHDAHPLVVRFLLTSHSLRQLASQVFYT